MAVTGFIHHFGTFLLLVATVLLAITSISSPVVNNISILTVKLGDGQGADSITFGTFGYCFRGGNSDGSDSCPSSRIGYSPADIVSEIDGTQYSSYSSNTAEALTRVMILHPIAAGVSFIAFVLSLGAGMFGSLFAALVSSVAFLITLVALVCDWVGFALVRSNVNNDDDGGASDSYAHFGVALWTLLAALICLFLGTVIVFFTCCSGRLHKRRQQRAKVDHYSPPATHTKYRRRRWWQRSRY
ncbi:pH-response regulator protein palI/RIM9 [Colletotrichum orbiculare MAFF 240422]|uniref:PH-response regulator protein palI/RIM9 n=1 Tax=Colletotrichum orbiculare (strain 104-T / ATCC 96160 / CBS 514.97 / LARS 414 / MAFF 240422) TaxID=1213857 RepID=N4VID4_COLOR|nr:pH-response regulator protein palI/RIM9 [Colletotrichum orbiculare MAFF 240422]